MAYTWKWHTVDVVTCALNILNHNVAVAVICDNDKFPSNLSPDTIYDTVICSLRYTQGSDRYPFMLGIIFESDGRRRTFYRGVFRF